MSAPKGEPDYGHMVCLRPGPPKPRVDPACPKCRLWQRPCACTGFEPAPLPDGKE